MNSIIYTVFTTGGSSPTKIPTATYCLRTFCVFFIYHHTESVFFFYNIIVLHDVKQNIYIPYLAKFT